MFGDLDGLALKQVKQDLYRNIVSLRSSQDLFDDLSDNPEDWDAGIALEMLTRPMQYESAQPIIDRPFEEAAYIDAILFPFDHWAENRFSRGRFGVWYGSETLNTTIYESVYHWRNNLLADAGWDTVEGVSIERRVHLVHCSAALINLLPKLTDWPGLTGDDYGPCQALGEQVHRQGHPGLWTGSARDPHGVNAAIFTPTVLSRPRTHCYLTYVLEGDTVAIYRSPGELVLKV